MQKITEHAEKSLVHRTATMRALQFKQLMEQKTTPVDVQLDRIKLKQIEENRKRLRPIVDAVIFCGRQNIPLRGHRDDSKHAVEESSNLGNFQEILKYGYRCVNTANDELHKMVPRNATYKSKTTQNQLIDICGEMLTEEIVAEIKDAKFFTILADEATDCSNIEQMSVVVWFVDNFDYP